MHHETSHPTEPFNYLHTRNNATHAEHAPIGYLMGFSWSVRYGAWGNQAIPLSCVINTGSIEKSPGDPATRRNQPPITSPCPHQLPLLTKTRQMQRLPTTPTPWLIIPRLQPHLERPRLRLASNKIQLPPPRAPIRRHNRIPLQAPPRCRRRGIKEHRLVTRRALADIEEFTAICRGDATADVEFEAGCFGPEDGGGTV